MAVHDDTNAFVFPTTGFDLLGTDRCGDGFYDGIVKVKTSANKELVLRDIVQKTCASKTDGTCALTGYSPYWTTEYSKKIKDE